MSTKVIDLIKKEEERQKNTLMMIASENYTHPEVRRAVGSVLMHKYSEGQVGKRYYQGNQFIDEIEEYCKKKVHEVFGLPEEDWGVNVQALSGSPANLAIFNALLKPGDKILSLYLPDGGHLSHGWFTGMKKITLVSKLYDVHFYNVNSKTGKIDYEGLKKKALEIKPKIIVSGGTAYPSIILHQTIKSIASKVGAYYMADIAHEAGLMATRALRPPFPFADIAMFTTHKTLRGPRGAVIISRKELSGKIDASVFPGIQGGPHNNVIAGIAVALEKTSDMKFREYTHHTIRNAKWLATKLSERGFKIIGEVEKHLVLVDMRSKKINGAFFARSLERIGIIVNKNTIPSEPNSPNYPSGIRIGTQALTARGFKVSQFTEIAKIIDEVAEKIGSLEADRDPGIRETQWLKLEEKLEDKYFDKLHERVLSLCIKFPINFE